MSNETQTMHCPVCASRISGDCAVQVCLLCQTPHHDDCARFIGQCSRYGCGGLRFDRMLAGHLAALQTASIELSDVSAERPAAVPFTPGLARGIGARLAAAARLLRQNPGIAAVVFFISFGLSLPFHGVLSTLAGTVGQAVTVILLAARARGKESTLREALLLTMQRGIRIVTYGFLSWMLGFTCLMTGIGLTISGLCGVMGALSTFVALCGFCLALLGFCLLVSFVLVPVLTAVGKEEEPANPLRRSHALVWADRKQAVLGMLLLFVVATVLPQIGGVWLAYRDFDHFTVFAWSSLLFRQALHAAATLLTSAYWVLFYIEARRKVERRA